MANFTFNNKHNFDDMDCIIVNPIKIPVAKENIDYESVEGRKGALTIKTGTYEDITITIDLQVNYINEYETDYKEKVQAISEWLYSIGDNKLVFDDNIEKCYMVKGVDISEFEDYKKFYSRFTVKFICEPFAKYINENTVEITKGYNIFNHGSVETEPIIELQLPSTVQNIQITINDKTFQLNNVKNYAYINSELFICKNEEGNIRTVGDFPILQKGNNKISWTGNIKKFLIKNNLKFRS